MQNAAPAFKEEFSPAAPKKRVKTKKSLFFMPELTLQKAKFDGWA